MCHRLPETGHLSAASAQNRYSRLETTELSGVLAFDHQRDWKKKKKPTPVSAALLLTHLGVRRAGEMSLSWPLRWGGPRFSVIRHGEQVALRVGHTFSMSIKANAGAPSGSANTVVMGVIREIGSNISSHAGSLTPMSFNASKRFPNVL